jgi:hypothetical protein
LTGDTLKKKILNAEVSRWNFILGEFFLPFVFSFIGLCLIFLYTTVVGEDELRDQSVNCRSRDDEKKGRSATLPLDDFVRKCLALKESRGGVSSTTVLEEL